MNHDAFQQPIDPFNSVQQQQQRFVQQVDKLFRDQVISVFANPHGQQLLDTLDDLYTRQPVSPPGCKKGYGYYREGQNSLVLRIRAIINSAQQESYVRVNPSTGPQPVDDPGFPAE